MDAKSLKKLEGVHLDLVAVVMRASGISPLKFIVTEGVRSLERQKELVKAGASKTMRSRHLTGHAVDLAPIVGGHVRWDWPLFHQIAAVMMIAAKELNVELEWGGDWKSFPDGPHFQLAQKAYP